MKITFVDAARKNQSKDGLDYEFWHFNESTDEVHSVYVVINQSVRAATAWHMTEQELADYAKKVFVAVVEMIERFWKQYRRLPGDGTEYYEGKALSAIGTGSLDWHNFELKLA